MNLVIDQGNTHIKYGVFDKRQLLHSDSVDFLDKTLIAKLQQKYHFEKAIISSVVSNEPGKLFEIVQKTIPNTIWLSHLTPLPFTWTYKTPETIGKDRLAAVAGAIEYFPHKDTLIIDAGTAITYEFVTHKAQYQGGNISPGLKMRFSSLHHFTSQLPLLTPSPDHAFFGKSTKEAIIAGIQNGITYEIDGYISTLKLSHPDVCVLITGGDAEFFARKLKNPIFVHLNLVLIGLNRILEHNAQ
ncbi:type III pantothenate kinase [Marinilabiliaceae bacterium JC017]|nr:type III pantothenate kinase [Marinilabiliaceae bacterium JC017]